MSTATTAAPSVVSGPHPPSPTVLHCDVGREALARDANWWLVTAPDRGWEADHGASCAAHLGVTDPGTARAAVRPKRSTYADAVAAAAEPRT